MKILLNQLKISFIIEKGPKADFREWLLSDVVDILKILESQLNTTCIIEKGSGADFREWLLGKGGEELRTARSWKAQRPEEGVLFLAVLQSNVAA